MLKWLRTALRLDDPKKWGEVVGYSTVTGEPMTRRSVLQLSAAWACTRLKSKVIGTLPLNPYRIVNGAPVIFKEHRLYPILRQKPNVDFTASRYWQSAVSALDLDGNAYFEKLRGSNDRDVVGLGWLNPALMECERRSGVLEYHYTDPVTRKRRKIDRANLCHVRQFSNGDDKGMSAVAYGAKALGLARDTVTAASATFGNGIRPGGFFTTGGRVLEDKQREDFKKAFISDRQGPYNAGWVGLLEGGFDWKEVSMKPEDAQMLESRRFDIEEICRWFDVPPIMIGHASEGQTMWGTGVEALQLQFQISTVAPLCIDVEQQLEADLLTPQDRGDGVFLRFNIDAMMRAAAADRIAFLGNAVDKGIMTRDEARAKENLPPKPGGDVLTVQQQMVPLEGIRERADKMAERGVSMPAPQEREPAR